VSNDVVVWAGDRWLFHCPGCNCAHAADSRWNFNGDTQKPTFDGSILVHGATHVHEGQKVEHGRCHSFITDGRIRFLADCTHELARQTVDMPPWETVR
jgi:hypothetical protein